MRAITDYGVVVTPSDTVELVKPGALFVGTGGTLKVKTVSGDDLTFGSVPDGYEVKCEVIQVYATGTSATNLVLYRDK